MNQATTAVYNLVAGNYNEADYIYWRERASELADQHGHREAVVKMAYELEDTLDDDEPRDLGQPFQELMSAALSEVDWIEVAKVALEDWERSHK